MKNGMAMTGCLLCSVLLFFCGTARAHEPIVPTWFVNISPWYYHTPSQIAASGAKKVVAMIGNYWDVTNPVHHAQIKNYLDNCTAAGLKVILSVQPLTHANNMTLLTALVDNFTSHPSLAGWHTAGEPEVQGVSLATCLNAYNIIKARSSLPVCIDGAPVSYSSAYDFSMGIMGNDYPCHFNEAEFGNGTEWNTLCSLTREEVAAYPKPVHMLPPAFGQTVDHVYPTWPYRLATYREERFLVYCALLNGVKGLEFWADYIREKTVASSGQAYPYTGDQWLVDVGEPLNAELNWFGAAIANGPVPNGVSDNLYYINSNVYMDPKTETYYLIAMNEISGTRTPTFTLNLPKQFSSATPLFETAASIPIQNNSFLVTFSGYDVHCYQLAPTIDSTTITTTTVDDTYIRYDAPTSNYRGDASMWLAYKPVPVGNQCEKDLLMRFDLTSYASTISQPGFQVKSAKIQIYAYAYSADWTAHTIWAHAIHESKGMWRGIAADYNNAPSWNNARTSPVLAWTTAGAKSTADDLKWLIGEAHNVPFTVVPEWVDIVTLSPTFGGTTLEALLKSWAGLTDGAYGDITYKNPGIKISTNGINDTSYKRAYVSTLEDPGHEPQLVIDYGW